MSLHLHSVYVEGCFRCELSRDEVADLPPLTDAEEHVFEDDCADPECQFVYAHFETDERWCQQHGRWAIGNPCPDSA